MQRTAAWKCTWSAARIRLSMPRATASRSGGESACTLRTRINSPSTCSRGWPQKPGGLRASPGSATHHRSPCFAWSRPWVRACDGRIMSKHKRAPVDFLKELQDGRSDAFLKIFSGVDTDEQQVNQDSGTRSSDTDHAAE